MLESLADYYEKGKEFKKDFTNDCVVDYSISREKENEYDDWLFGLSIYLKTNPSSKFPKMTKMVADYTRNNGSLLCSYNKIMEILEIESRK